MHEDEGVCEDVWEREWRVGGEDEEECKIVVEMNISYEMHCALRIKCINNKWICSVLE
jgi:hypothetical protein